MKKYIYQLLCSLFIGATMVACTEDYMETDKGHDTLTLSVEAVTVSLIRLNWRKPERTLRMLIRWIWVRERINGLRKWKNLTNFCIRSSVSVMT